MITIRKLTEPLRCTGCSNSRNDTGIYKIEVGERWANQSVFILCKDCLQNFDKQLADQLTDDAVPVPPHESKWFNIWMQDKENILAAMNRNLAADLDAGYSYTGKSIQSQLTAIDEYIDEFDAQLISFVSKSNKEVSDWCYYDLKKRGSVE